MKIHNHEKTNGFSILFEESDKHLIGKKFYVEGTYDNNNWVTISWGAPDPESEESESYTDYITYEVTEVPMFICLFHTGFLEVRTRWEIREKQITISESQFDEAWDAHSGNINTKSYIKKRLGAQMIINKEFLKNFKPCDDRWKNFLKYYTDFNGSFDEFVDLENCSYEDKIWVAKNVLNKNRLCHFGLLCAESVLYIFEEKYPQDKRVGDCIRYLMKVEDFSNITAQQKEEILEHRRAADAAGKKMQQELNLELLKVAASL